MQSSVNEVIFIVVGVFFIVVRVLSSVVGVIFIVFRAFFMDVEALNSLAQEIFMVTGAQGSDLELGALIWSSELRWRSSEPRFFGKNQKKLKKKPG